MADLRPFPRPAPAPKPDETLIERAARLSREAKDTTRSVVSTYMAEAGVFADGAAEILDLPGLSATDRQALTDISSAINRVLRTREAVAARS